MNRIKFSLLVVMIVILTFLLGCGNNEIVDKLATGQALTADENERYQNNKDSFDKFIKTRKQEIEATRYKEATDSEVVAGKRQYMRSKGIESEFDITPQACQKFGFLAGSKIEMPSKKEAYIVGVFEDHLWFHVEGNKGATFSRNKNLEEFTKEGYEIISEEKFHGEGAIVDQVKTTPNASIQTRGVSKSGDKVEDNTKWDNHLKPIKPIKPTKS